MATKYRQHQQDNDYCEIKSSMTVKSVAGVRLAAFLMSVKELGIMQKKREPGTAIQKGHNSNNSYLQDKYLALVNKPKRFLSI